MTEHAYTVADIIALCESPKGSDEPRLYQFLGINKRTQDYWHLYGTPTGIPEKYWEGIIARAKELSNTELTVQQIYDANQKLRAQAAHTA